MLQIDNLHAEVDGKPILKGLSLALNAGEVDAVMGPHGAGTPPHAAEKRKLAVTATMGSVE